MTPSCCHRPGSAWPHRGRAGPASSRPRRPPAAPSPTCSSSPWRPTCSTSRPCSPRAPAAASRPSWRSTSVSGPAAPRPPAPAAHPPSPGPWLHPPHGPSSPRQPPGGAQNTRVRPLAPHPQPCLAPASKAEVLPATHRALHDLPVLSLPPSSSLPFRLLQVHRLVTVPGSPALSCPRAFALPGAPPPRCPHVPTPFTSLRSLLRCHLK